jgi:hypothetical protein
VDRRSRAGSADVPVGRLAATPPQPKNLTAKTPRWVWRFGWEIVDAPGAPGPSPASWPIKLSPAGHPILPNQAGIVSIQSKIYRIHPHELIVPPGIRSNGTEKLTNLPFPPPPPLDRPEGAATGSTGTASRGLEPAATADLPPPGRFPEVSGRGPELRPTGRFHRPLAQD